MVIIYLCIKSEKCFCTIQQEDRDETPDPEYANVPAGDSGTEMSDVAAMQGSLAGANFIQSTGDLSNNQILSSEEEDNLPGVARIGEVVSDAEGSVSARLALPREKPKKGKRKRSQSMDNLRKGLGNLQLTFQYSKKEILFVVIHKINGFLPNDFLGIENIRISMVLLPAKKHRGKTKYVPVSEEPEFGASFRFPNVSRADLFRLAVRFRLYGRHVRLGMQVGKEKLMGEITVHLADVAQKERTTTSRPFSQMIK